MIEIPKQDKAAQEIFQQQIAQDNIKFEQLQQHNVTTQTQNKQKIERLKTQIKPLLEQPAKCQETDLKTAIAKVALIAQEPRVVKGKQFALFVTDGIDDVFGTTKRPTAKLPEDMEVLLVNGTGSSGIFADISHKRFESVDSAVNYIIETMEN